MLGSKQLLLDRLALSSTLPSTEASKQSMATKADKSSNLSSLILQQAEDINEKRGRFASIGGSVRPMTRCEKTCASTEV